MSDDRRKKQIDDDDVDFHKVERDLPCNRPDDGDSAEEFIDFDRPLPRDPGEGGAVGGEGGMGGRE